MSDLYGYNFSPDLANKFRSSLNSPTGASQLGPEVGQALRVISLHLPEFTGGSPIAPDSLLRPSHSFTPDTAVRAQTAGIPPPSSPAPPQVAGPSLVTSRPITSMPMPRVPFAGSLPDNGPGTSTSFGLPNINFGGQPNNGDVAPAPTPAPTVGGPAGGGMDTQNPLSGLLDAFLRTGRGV